MIRLSALQRWGPAVVFGAVAVFVTVGAVANAAMRHWSDCGFLLGFAGFLTYSVVLRWTRFAEVTEDGLVYNNWGPVRLLRWERIARFDVRRTWSRPVGWIVVARRGRGRSVTIRATEQPGSYRQRPSPGELAARELAAALESRRQAVA